MTSAPWHNIRYALRLLRLNPAFALVAILSLALGAGANTAIFQLLDTIRLRSLPLRAPQELAELRIDDMTHARGSAIRDLAVTNPIWEQIRARQQVFSGVFAWADESLNMAPNGDRHPVAALWVSGDFFPVLGVQPLLGRTFTENDDRRGCGLAPGAVISYGFWQSEFGGDKSILGRKLAIAENRLDIIGVTPPGFFGLEVGRTFDIALPLCSQPALQPPSRLESGTTWWLTVMGRLKPAMSLQQASAVMRAVSPAIFEAALPPDFPSDSVKPYLAMKFNAIPAGGGISRLRDQYSTPLGLLLAIAALVLLIACANLASLMLARASARRREIAVRLALGATRSDLLQQLMTEALLIAAAGASLGLFFAQSLSRFLVSLLTTSADPSFVDLRPDWRIFAFTASLAVLTCVLFGLAPAWRAARTDPGDALKSGGRNTSSGPEGLSLRRLLVSSQIALSLVLLAGALLFVRSLRNLATVDPGFQQHGVLFADIGFAHLHLPPARTPALRREILDRVRAIPGVASASEATVVPVTGGNWNNRVWMDGSDLAHARVTLRSMIGSDYFRTLKTPLLAGRAIDENDLASAAKVAVVNETFAREITGPGSAIGRRFHLEATPFEPEAMWEIIGIAKDAKYRDLRESFQPVAYFPMWKRVLESPNLRLMIRAGARPDTVFAALRTTLAAINPNIGYSFHIFDTWIQDSLLSERLMAVLSGLFGALAITLTAIGLYGVISYTVSRRASEIGIRIALGAARGTVIGLILRETALVLAIGLCAGTVLALAAARFASTALFGLKPYDPPTFVASAAAITLLAVAASYIPARRASLVNPVIALRQE